MNTLVSSTKYPLPSNLHTTVAQQHYFQPERVVQRDPVLFLLIATPANFFCFAFLAGAIAETSHPLHIVAPNGQSKQKLNLSENF